MRATRRLVTVLVALAAATLIAAPTGSAAPQKIAWSKCFAQFGPFQCGTAQVPLDYDGPAAGTISIALVRLPASDPARRIGSLFLNPGGPGGSGVDFAVFGGPFLFSEEVRARFDLVGFDPRGIMRSTALRCFGTPRQWGPFFTPFAFPTTPAEEELWIAGDRYLDASCAQRGGRIADHMSTANVARDLDVLRAAVGDAKLTYAGYSYGTFLGVTYANLFPNKVRALIVDGVLDPIAWTTGVGGESATTPFSTRLRSDAGSLATLNEFFRLCDDGGSACAFSGGAAARYAALAAKLKSDPLVFPDGFVFGYSDLVGASLGAMYDSFSWADFAQFLADVEAEASPATIAAAFEQFAGPNGYIAKRGFPRYPNFVEGFPAVACADTVNPTSYPAWSTAATAAGAAFGYFGPLWTWITSICAEWPAADEDRYLGPFTAHTSNPVLVIGNQFDPATRYEGAVTVAGLLPNSRLLTVHGWGHTSLFLSACADEAASEYLLDVTLPSPGTVCEQDVVPFAGP
jgi:pimeloyl-ACP methyl ester carboxylesterase